MHHRLLAMSTLKIHTTRVTGADIATLPTKTAVPMEQHKCNKDKNELFIQALSHVLIVLPKHKTKSNCSGNTQTTMDNTHIQIKLTRTRSP